MILAENFAVVNWRRELPIKTGCNIGHNAFLDAQKYWVLFNFHTKLLMANLSNIGHEAYG
jgi:hypothetical protein